MLESYLSTASTMLCRYKWGGVDIVSRSNVDEFYNLYHNGDDGVNYI